MKVINARISILKNKVAYFTLSLSLSFASIFFLSIDSKSIRDVALIPKSYTSPSTGRHGRAYRNSDV